MDIIWLNRELFKVKILFCIIKLILESLTDFIRLVHLTWDHILMDSSSCRLGRGDR